LTGRQTCLYSCIMTPASRREDVLRTASELFYQEGIRSVGIDRIIERAGVSKMTLYNHFSSKDELAVAYLRRRDEAVHRFIEARVVELAPDPRHRPLAIFEAFAEQLARDNYRGCHLINTMIEFPDEDHPARQFALDLNHGWRAYVAELIRAAQLPEAEALAEEFFLLLEGAFVTGAMEGRPDSMNRARRAAEALLTEAQAADAGSAKRRA
jgi:AcrR family transcriptional regulator